MEIAALNLADDEAVSACRAVCEYAMRVDDPVAAPTSATAFRASLSAGPTGGPYETWYVPRGDGAVAGWYQPLGITEVRRVQDLAQIQAGAVTRLRETTTGAASGYSLVRWTGVTPEERTDQVAALHEALNDSPRDAAVEPTAWTPERVRGRMNARIARSPLRRYSLAAMHDGTGEMAALTSVTVDPDVPDWGHQLITAVSRPHRGHRLGLLVKTEMLDWLAEAEPRLEHIDTWNAGSNQHMIAINETLGYAVSGQFRSAELRVSGTALKGAI